MLIKKGWIVEVNHTRSGKWFGIATEDFDTKKDEWYSLKLCQKNKVEGMKKVWFTGDDMPARRGLCQLIIIKKNEKK